MLLKFTGVPKSSYCYWDRHGRVRHEARQREEVGLVEVMEKIHADSGESYGSPRMVTELANRGHRISLRRCAEVMSRHQIQGTCGRKPNPRTTVSTPGLVPFPDLVNRNFHPEAPDTVYYGDITYVRVRDRFHYLATVLDAATKEVVGWALDDNMEAGLVKEALQAALAKRHYPNGVIFHSDRGSQYSSKTFTDYCRANNVRQSMGRTGICFDNAGAESFFATLKRELVDRYVWDDQMILRFHVFEWIEDWYNKRRLHTTLGNIPPAQAYANFRAGQATR